MKEFYYQIKGLNDDGRWAWPPIYSDRIEAEDSKQARKELEEIYGMKMPGGRLKKDADNQRILLTLIDMSTSPFLRDRFVPKECKQCGKAYTLNEKYMVNAGGQPDYCSASCTQDFKNEQGISFNVNFDFDGIHESVIYKITNKITGLCYIGKTNQAFTLRWYQHFYQGCGTPFHAAIKHYGIINWTFEVIEVLGKLSRMDKDARTKILERESYWINHFNSVKNGYNSVISKKEQMIDDNGSLFAEIEKS